MSVSFAGIVQEANLSMVHLASNKALEQHTLWQVLLLHFIYCDPLPSDFQFFRIPCKLYRSHARWYTIDQPFS